MSVIKKISRRINGFEISTKITLGYAACFFLLMMVINAAMWFGVMTALYSPAEKTIRYSMTQIKKVLDELEENYGTYNPRRGFYRH